MSRDATPLDVIEGRAAWCVVTGDCRDVLATLPAGCVDAVVTDPPYLTTDLAFDLAGLDAGWIEATERVTQANGYLACFGPIELLAQVAARWGMRWHGVWFKPRGSMRTATAKKPMQQSELYAVFARHGHEIARLTWNQVEVPGAPYRVLQRCAGYQRGGKDQLDRSNTSSWTRDGYVSENYGTRRMTDVLSGPFKACMSYDERTEHPTQKPIEAITPLVLWLTNLGDLILDPYAGSGTTGVAAIQTGRRVILCEIDPTYADIARDRCERAAMQPRLIPDAPPPRVETLALDFEAVAQ